MGDTYRIQVSLKSRITDGRAERLSSSVRSLGVTGLQKVEVTDLYFISGNLDMADADRLCRDLLVDPVSQEYRVQKLVVTRQPEADLAPLAVEVTFRPGVTDSVADSIVRGSKLIGIHCIEAAATGTRFVLHGALSVEQAREIATSLLCNELIQHFALGHVQPSFLLPSPSSANKEATLFAIRLADDEGLAALSRQRMLSLNLQEMQAIRAWFRDAGRDPTDVELETIAQTWSEHCGHKTFRGAVDYEEYTSTAEDDLNRIGPAWRESIDGLLKSYLRRATEEIGRPWVRSAFVDNAGIIDFEPGYEISFKVETHNHPSALEPFGGANTGMGGVIRDIIGVSARPIANTDVLCFGLQDRPFDDLPGGTLHPQRVFAGVVSGVEDYGNKMGIPTVGGAILFDPGYEANPLVFCGCLGLAPAGLHRNCPEPGDRIILVGGRTGRDGLRGATFSSAELTPTTPSESGSAVQIGNPIVEKKSLEAIMAARDAGLYHAITDCGGGGLSSAVGEMGRDLGVVVQLERIPLKYAGLSPWEIWLSEAQERMILAVPSENLGQLRAVCDCFDVEATDIGEFTGRGRLELRMGSLPVADLSMAFLHDGLPQRRIRATWAPRRFPRPAHHSGDLTPVLFDLLRSPNIASKESIIRRYDHEVQGATVVKPLVGTRGQGPSDAAVLRPCLPDASRESRVAIPAKKGIVLSHGINPGYSALDPYLMARAAIDEAVRNAVSVGADPDRLALLDNFCWGNPDLPDRMGDLVRACKGCYDGAVAYQAPFISGKDSLNNEFTDASTGRKISVPPTLLISAVGIIPDVERAVTMDLKHAGDLLYALGETQNEMGGSHYYRLMGEIGTQPPTPPKNGLAVARALHRAIMSRLVQACHDCSEGGWGVAAAEMAIAGDLGLSVDLGRAPGVENISDDATLCFSESNGRFLIEVRPEAQAAFEAALAEFPLALVGSVYAEPVLVIRGLSQKEVVRAATDELERAWRGTPTVRKQALSKEAVRPVSPGPPATRSRPPVLILHASGTNRDREAALACDLAGGRPTIAHISEIVSGRQRLTDYVMLVLPGGFSYSDDLGAGVLLAADLRYRFAAQLQDFIKSGRAVLGICNGFQALVKAGVLPGADEPSTYPSRSATLTFNRNAHFECRWVHLRPNPDSPCVFTQGVRDLLYVPVAHGEGRFLTDSGETLDRLVAQQQVVFTYVNEHGETADYPENPNGSALGIAGICNPQGNVLGLMPHPEDHVLIHQHPRWTRGESGAMGLPLFETGMRYVAGL